MTCSTFPYPRFSYETHPSIAYNTITSTHYVFVPLDYELVMLALLQPRVFSPLIALSAGFSLYS
jgi:hypothetical protein